MHLQIEKDNIEVKALFSHLSQLYRVGYRSDEAEGNIFRPSNLLEPSNSSGCMYQKWFNDIENSSLLSQSSESFIAFQSDSDMPSRTTSEKLRSLLFAGCQYESLSKRPKITESSYLTFKNEARNENKNGLDVEMLLSFLDTSGFRPLQILLKRIPGIDTIHQNKSSSSPFLASMSYLDSIGKGLSNVQLSRDICSTLLMQSPTSSYTKSSQDIPANTCTSIEIPAIGKIVDNNPSNAFSEDTKKTDDYEKESIDPSVQLFDKLQQLSKGKTALNNEEISKLLSPVFPPSLAIDAAIDYLKSLEVLTINTTKLNGITSSNIVTCLPCESNTNSELLNVELQGSCNDTNVCNGIEGEIALNSVGSSSVEWNDLVEDQLADIKDAVLNQEGVCKLGFNDSSADSPSASIIKADRAAEDLLEIERSSVPSFAAPMPLLLFPVASQPYDATPNDTSGAMALLALLTDCVCTPEFDNCFSNIDSTPFNASDMPSIFKEDSWNLDKKRKLIEDSPQDIVMKRQQRCPRCKEFKKGHICIYDTNAEA